MKEFFLILLFSRSVLLTPGGIDISSEWVPVSLEEPLEAITPGASLYVDVTNCVDKGASIDALDSIFPPGAVRARLVHSDGQQTFLHSGSAYSFDSGKTYLILSSEQGVPTSKEISELHVISDKKLRNTFLIWRNYRK